MRLFPTPDFLTEFRARIRGTRTVELGCGGDKTPGAIGVDIRSGPGVDIVHDLDIAPWPFADSEFDSAVMDNVVEHLRDIPAAMSECARILKRDGLLWIATPHYSDPASWTDPSHLAHLGARSFMGFCDSAEANFRLEFAYVSLKGRWKSIGYERWINRGNGNNRISRGTKRWEDKHCFVRRGGEMSFVLRRR